MMPRYEPLSLADWKTQQLPFLFICFSIIWLILARFGLLKKKQYIIAGRTFTGGVSPTQVSPIDDQDSILNSLLFALLCLALRNFVDCLRIWNTSRRKQLCDMHIMFVRGIFEALLGWILVLSKSVG